MEHDEIAALAETISTLPDDEFLELLRLTFVSRTFAPEEAAHLRSRYFVGLACSYLDRPSKSGSEEVWEPWETHAVAYPDTSVYGTWRGPDYSFAQEGTCGTCNASLRAQLKNAICPVCGSNAGLT